MKKLALHWKILIGVVLGIIWGLFSVEQGFGDFTNDWIKPFGEIFMFLLKMVAVPLVLVSLVDGITNLRDISGVSRMGGKTIGLYIMTTVIAISFGLILVNVINPGSYINEEKKIELQEKFSSDAAGKIQTAETEQSKGPLNFLKNMVPDNVFRAMAENNMLQVIVFALLLGIAMVMTPRETMMPVKNFFNGMNAIILKMVDVIMLFAPFGVFALLASMNADLEMLAALGVYCITVILGLALMIFVIYPLMQMVFTGKSTKDILHFFKSILPAQLLAFSTSSSAAALPVNIECCEKNLGLREETTGFVLPIGATINMDGTSLYQAVAAIFIAQVYGIELTLSGQLGIILTATMASIGAAPVPGAGMVMLVIILQSAGINAEGLALIIGVDRILDMFRTTVNVTSDATVASIVDHTERKRQTT